MSDAKPTRLILFEVAEAVYALPIADVLEVLENRDPVGIPTLPPATGGVVNHHGEALPVVAPAALFEAHSHAEAEHLLVLGGIGSEAGQLGIPVERVLGLADAVLDTAPSADWIRQRVTLEDRVVAVLDAERCVDRAERAFAGSLVPERAAARGTPPGLEERLHEL